MTRPWQVRAAFLAAVLAVLGAMGWASATLVRLDREQGEARRDALLEENVRLALWRIESALTPIIVRESARPHFVYSARYSAQRAFTGGFARLAPGETGVPSPLLDGAPPHVLLHFQIDGEGRLSSPQVRPGGPGGSRDGAAEASRRLASFASGLSRRELLERLEAPGSIELVSPAPPPRGAQESAAAKLRGKQEFHARAQNYIKQQALLPPPLVSGAAPVEVAGSPMQPVWVDGALLLVRRVRVGGDVYVQGCQLDWPELKRELLGSIADLLPEARLEPASSDAPAEEERRVAALPLRLVAGPLPGVPEDPGSPLRWWLVLAWAGVVLAVLGVGVALESVIALSERRRVFVSAVTHELRTPLTTFRLYADMLAGGMVASEAGRREYLERLQGEASRLAHLVENVLFYARVESGRGRVPHEPFALRPFLERQVEALGERAVRAGLRLEPDLGAAEGLGVRADAAAVERILINLVDNACRYASAGGLVRLRAFRAGSAAAVAVEDRGPGLSRRDRRRLFRPFSKSDREAAQSAPGVGLGLALCRRLARAMGGDLRLAEGRDGGASFVLTLPLAEGGAEDGEG